MVAETPDRLRTLARVCLALLITLIYATLGVVRIVTTFLREAGFLRITVAFIFAIAAAIALRVIFGDPARRNRRVVIRMILVIILYAVVIFPMDSPEEKVHFVEYGLVALLAWTAAPASWTGRKRYVLTWLFVVAAGWIDEGIQYFLPSRIYDPRDVAFNATAGLLALGALALVRAASVAPAEPPG